jgi:hypothetical protein
LVAPLAFNVSVLPGQIVWVVPPVSVTVGVGVTLTTKVKVELLLLQPAALVPVTVYVVVTVGLTVILAVVCTGVVFHTYVAAPLAFNVVEPPEHILADGAAEAVTVGVVFTVTTTVAGVVLEQPAVVVPTTVYVVVVVGLAVVVSWLVLVNAVGGVHVYVPPTPVPPPVKWVDEPEHIGVEGEAEAVTVGVWLTVTVNVTAEALVHPPLVAVTLYVFIPTGGVTVMLEPLEPLLHE